MRRGLAGLVLGMSLVLASVAWAGFTMSRTVLDPGRSERLAEQLFDNPQLRAALVDRVAAGLGAALPDGAPAVPDQLLEQAASAALDDPSVQAVVRDGIVRTHRNALEGNDEPVTVDASALGAAGRASLVEIRPELAVVLPEVPPLAVTLPTSGLSRLGAVKDFVDRFTVIAAAIAAIGAMISLVVTSDRPAVLRRVAFWAFGAAAFWLVIGFGLPWVANRIAPTSAAIVAAVIDVFFGAMIPPALVMGLVGAALLGGSFVWSAAQVRQGAAAIQPRRDRTRRPIESGGRVSQQPRPSVGQMSNIRGRTDRATPRPRPSPAADPTAVQPRPAAAPSEPAQQATARPGGPQEAHAGQSSTEHATSASDDPAHAVRSPAPDVWSLTDPVRQPAPKMTTWVEGVGYIDEDGIAISPPEDQA